MIDWKKKLASRKLWLAVAGFVTALYVILTTDVTAEKITALIVSFGSVCSYIFAEGWTDASHAPYVTGGADDADGE